MADPVVAVSIASLERRLVKVAAERDARLTIAEARSRLLDAIGEARQAVVYGTGHVGNLFGDEPEKAERRMVLGVQTIALADFNDALDQAFPVEGKV